MSRRILMIDHHENLQDDRVSTYLTKLGYELDWCRPAIGDPLPDAVGDLAGCVVYGGLYNLDEIDRYPFLQAEADWILKCHAHQLPLFGICLGAQLIAHVFGGKVTPMPGGRCEFGYYRVTPTTQGKNWFPEPLYLAQAHFYEIELPPTATLMAVGEGCINQMFRCGEFTHAVQFHPEVSAEIFRRWQDTDWSFHGAKGAQPREQQDALAAEHDAAQHRWITSFLDQLFADNEAS